MIGHVSRTIRNIARAEPSLFDAPGCAVLFAAISLVVLLAPLRAADPDLYARLAVGRQVLALGAFPATDPFAFTERLPRWVDHEWLSGVVFFLLKRTAGEGSLVIFKFVLAALTLWFVYSAQRLRGGYPWVRSMLLLPGALALFPVWRSTVRAQVFTYLFVAALLFLTERARAGTSRPLILLPPVFLLWANLHGGCVIGFAILGAYLLDCRHSQRLGVVLAGVGSVLATIANPFGVEYWRYLLRALGMPRPNVSEWGAVSPFSAAGVLLLVCGGMFLLSVLREPERFGWGLRLLFLAMLGFGFRHLRLVPLPVMAATIFAAPGSAVLLEFFLERAGRLRAILKRAVSHVAAGLFIGVGALAGALVCSPETYRLSEKQYPVRAADWLEDCGARGRLLVDFNNGSYMLWRLGPRMLVSLDGRYEELYPQETVDLVQRVYSGDAAHAGDAVRTLDPDFILTRKSRGELLSRSGVLYGFEQVFSGDGFQLYVRPQAQLSGNCAKAGSPLISIPAGGPAADPKNFP